MHPLVIPPGHECTFAGVRQVPLATGYMDAVLGNPDHGIQGITGVKPDSEGPNSGCTADAIGTLMALNHLSPEQLKALPPGTDLLAPVGINNIRLVPAAPPIHP